MFNLDEAVERWKTDALDAEPTLARSIDEVGEHLFSQVEYQVDAGIDPAFAFAEAVERLGSPLGLAAEFRQAQHPIRRAYDSVVLDPTGESQQRVIAVAHVVTALCWAAAMILFDETQWLLVGFMTLTFMPLTMLSAKYSGMSTKT